LKFFRNLIGLQDDFYNSQMIQHKLFAPILDMLIETMPRDNLLNSACLEFFDFIKRENIKTVIMHLVETYREKMATITYVDIFSNFIIRYDQTSGFAPSLQTSFVETEDGSQRQGDATKTNRWNSGIKDLDASEEEYFNTSDDDEENKVPSKNMNGRLGGSKRLVDYGSDDDMDNEALEESEGGPKTPDSSKDSSAVLTPGSSPAPTPPERLSEKRRREEDEEDDISKLAQNSKRRNSTTSNSSTGLKRKKSFTNSNQGTGTKGTKIAISLSPAIKSGGEAKGGEDSNN
jgi:protein phosphatase-4 regulatory subunit 3